MEVTASSSVSPRAPEGAPVPAVRCQRFFLHGRPGDPHGRFSSWQDLQGQEEFARTETWRPCLILGIP